jgi:hypothetical protein
MSSSSPEASGSEPPVVPAAAAGMCVHHPDLRASFVCSACKQLICELCAFTRTDGTRVCSQCASSPAALAAEAGARLSMQGYAAPSRVHALKCLQHPNVAAIQVCKGCGGPMCGTCDFLLPGDLHLCPRCVAAPPKRMSGQRRGLIIAAYVFAVWGTFAIAVRESGVLQGMVQSPGDQIVLGYIIILFIRVPVLIGAGLGFSCFDPRLRNPPAVWIAAIWNGLLLLIYVAGIFLYFLK